MGDECNECNNDLLYINQLIVYMGIKECNLNGYKVILFN